MRKVFELVRDDQVDATCERLSELPVNLGEMVVLYLMERYEDDPDVCSGTDCDNLGKTAFDRPRVLLVSRGDASALMKMSEAIGQVVSKLPALAAARPTISQGIATTSALAEIYRQTCKNIHAALMETLATLDDQLPGFKEELAAQDWTAQLAKYQEQFSGNRDAGIQYYYDFLKDVVDTWNELREVLLGDSSLLCPPVYAFPRHLLLGDLTTPLALRTGLFPSPLVGGQGEKHDHVVFLIRKLDAQIDGFKLPSLQEIPLKTRVRVTPSRTEADTLEERAIPWYYPREIQTVWNNRLTQRGETANIYGYHTSTSDVFGRQIGRYDFFRVEGHFGMEVTAAAKAIEDAITAHNLPFSVRAVLLHQDREKIVIRPAIRYGDLHRFHHLLRKDLSVQLAETKVFSGKLQSQIDAAVKDKSIPNLDVAIPSAQVKSAAEEAAPALATNTFAKYQEARKAHDWRAGFKTVVNAANSFKGALGEVTRTNFATAFDTLVTNNHPSWLEDLESLIESKDVKEDAKLMFPKFCQQHPQLEHFGGVTRGGTLVLVYDDQAKVVADFMLPYNWAETAEDEPDEEEKLTAPSYKLPELFEHSIKVLPPLDFKFDQRFAAFETSLKGTVLKDQADVQNRQLDFLKQSVQVLGGKPGLVDPRRDIQNPVLKSLLEEVEHKQRLVEEMRGLSADPATPEEVRTQSKVEMVRLEQELANSITHSSEFLVSAEIGMEAGSDGGKAIAVISSGMDKVNDKNALKTLKTFGAAVESPELKHVFKLRGL